MANLIGIMGEPGSGKSTSLRNLNPEETYYCDCDGKAYKLSCTESALHSNVY